MSDQYTLKQVEILGGVLEYIYIPGEKDLPTLVMLHEGLGSISTWKEFPKQKHFHNRRTSKTERAGRRCFARRAPAIMKEYTSAQNVGDTRTRPKECQTSVSSTPFAVPAHCAHSVGPSSFATRCHLSCIGGVPGASAVASIFFRTLVPLGWVLRVSLVA